MAIVDSTWNLLAAWIAEKVVSSTRGGRVRVGTIGSSWLGLLVYGDLFERRGTILSWSQVDQDELYIEYALGYSAYRRQAPCNWFNSTTQRHHLGYRVIHTQHHYRCYRQEAEDY
jgi:hypothetical protein